MAHKATTESVVVQAAKKDHHRGPLPKGKKHKKRHEPKHYKPGHKYGKALSGWHRHGKRPSDWLKRGCIVVGPVWFCP